MLNKNIIVLANKGSKKNAHIEKNLKIFAELGIEHVYMSNMEFLFKNLRQYDGIYLNWFENIDGGSTIRVLCRYVLKRIQLHRMKSAGLRVLFTKHNKMPHGKKLLSLSLDVYYRACDLASTIVAFNNDAEQDLKEIFKTDKFSGKIRVIPPVNYIGSYKINSNSKIYASIPKTDGRMHVLFFGKIMPYKNIEIVLRAAEELSHENILFIIAGRPSPEDYAEAITPLLKKARGNVICMIERIEDNDVAALLERSDILVMPYDIESASNSGTGRLAFSYKRTVISPLIPSMKEIPSDLIYTYTYSGQEEHYGNFKSCLKKAYDDFQESQTEFRLKGEKLFYLMEKEYSEEKVKMLYLECFKEVFK